jgi:hypothetical protein
MRDELRVAAFRRHGLSAKLVVNPPYRELLPQVSLPSSTPFRFSSFFAAQSPVRAAARRRRRRQLTTTGQQTLQPSDNVACANGTCTHEQRCGVSSRMAEELAANEQRTS